MIRTADGEARARPGTVAEEWFELAQRAARAGAWHWDLVGGTVSWTDELFRLFGLDPDRTEPSVESWLAAVHEDDHTGTERAVREVLGRPGDFAVEFRVVHPERGVRWCVSIGQTAHDERGRPLHMAGVTLDITDRKRTEEALRDSEQRFRALAEALPQLVWVARPDGDNEYLNRRWIDYTGLPLEQSLGSGWSQALHPDDRERTLACWERARQAGEGYEIEYRLRGADGAYRWFLARALPVRDPEGRIVHWFGTCTDIDAERRAKERAVEDESRLRLAIEAAGLGLWDVDLRSGAVRESERMGPMFGNPPGYVFPDLEAWARQVHPEDRARVQALFDAAAAGGAPYEAEYRTLGSDGQTRWVTARGAALRDASGRPARMIGVARDITRYKEIEDALRENEERFRQIADNIADVFWIHDLDRDRCIYVNPAFERIWGFSRERFYRNGRELVAAAHPEDRARVLAAFRAQGVRGDYDEEYRILRPDGSIRWIRDRGFPVRDEAGEVHRIVGIAADITERRRAEAALRDREERLRRFIESDVIGILEGDIHGRVFRANDTLLQIVGYSRAELDAGQVSWSDLTPPEWLPLDRERIAEAQRRGSCTPYEKEYVRKDGGRVPVLVGYVLLGEAREESIAFVVDLSEQKHAERERQAAQDALRASEDRFRRLFESNVIGLLTAGSDGRITEANDAFLAMVGYTRDDLSAGRLSWPRMTPDDYRRLDERALRELSARGYCTPYEKEYVHRDGRRVPILIGAVRLAAPSREWMAFVLDITGRKRAERAIAEARDAAEAASKLKDQFLAALSHELRTPLTPVLLGVAGLEADPRLPAPLREDVALVRRNIEMEVRLIDDLLDLTRITQGKLELRSDVVDVHDLIRHAVRICRADCDAKGLRLDLRLRAEPPFVRGDAARLQQVVWNLVKNAAKFTPEGGAVTIATGPGAGADRLRIEVRDTGIGIAPEVLPRIFDAFEQGEQQITRQFGGLGLGLAISKALVQAHGGTIAAASAGRDRGSTFRVGLAQVPRPAEPVREAGRSDGLTKGRTLRILLVEDHADTARLLARVLGRAGHAVATADSLASALRLATESGFDLLISDLGLPDGSGLDLMRRLRPLPGIALTGYGMERDIERCLEAGFADHLTKPVDPDRLQAAIREIASGPA